VAASLSYDARGVPVDVTILESPDADIGVAVLTTLQQWRFRPNVLSDKSIPARTTGRLVFYFTQNDGLPTVTDAAKSLLGQEMQGLRR
jgi:hypothetical protein